MEQNMSHVLDELLGVGVFERAEDLLQLNFNILLVVDNTIRVRDALGALHKQKQGMKFRVLTH